MNKNLWDDIQIEINAEFEKVKMTIGELKQITKGQVVDLGSIFENEISLFVENKKVAKGELLIINDRYAVRLSEILSSANKEETEEKISLKAPAKPKAQKPQPPQPQEPQRPIQSKASAPQIEEDEDIDDVDEDEDDDFDEEDEEFDYSDFEK